MNKGSLTTICIAITVLLCVQATYANQIPVAAIDANPTSATIGQTVTFDGTGSYDPDGTVEAYLWEFPSSAYYISATDTDTVKCKFNSNGTHTVKLKVQDDYGVWSTYDEYQISVSAASSSTWYISSTGDDDNNGQSWANAFATVQIGIDTAANGETVKVGQGTYTEQITINGKNIMLQGIDPNDWDVVEQTILDGDHSGATVVFDGTETSACLIEGLTVSRGAAGYTLEPTAYWKLDENANDSGSNGYNGTIVGDPNWISSSRIDQGIELYGDEYLQITNYNGIIGNHSRTCSAWIKTDAPGGQIYSILSWGEADPSGGKKWLFFLDEFGSTESRLAVGIWGCRLTGSTPLNNGVWHHVVAVYNSVDNKFYLYVDGKLETSGTPSVTPDTANTENVFIGTYQDLSEIKQAKFEGVIDGVCIYDRALEPEEIVSLAGNVGLVAHWKLDNDPNDSSGNGYHGTLNGSPVWDPNGYWNECLDFDGVNDYVSSPSNIISPSETPFSAVCWVRLDSKSSSLQVILQQADDQSEGIGRAWLYRDTDDTLCSYLGGSSTVSTDTVFQTTGQWCHVGIVYDGQNVTLYANGKECGSSTKNAENCTGEMLIGTGKTFNPSNMWAGPIDDARVYNRVLSNKEIAELADNNLLVGYWTLDGDPNDISGNTYDGTANSDPNWLRGMFGEAVELCGNESITLPDSMIDPAETPFSALAWVRLDEKYGTDVQIILQQCNGDATHPGRSWLYRRSSDDALCTSIGNTGTVSSSPIFTNTNEWHFVGVTYDGQTVRLYADGQLCQTANVTAENCTGQFYIGRFKLDGYESQYAHWRGLIDEVQIYDICLSDYEIRKLYECGGGIQGNGTQATISKCLITGNYSDWAGGGIYGFDGTIKNSIITDNTSNYMGGGIAHSDGTVENCTIIGNNATESGGGLADCVAIIKNNIIWGNSAAANVQIADSNTPSYSNIQDWISGGTGNITTDPNFVDAAGGDYHLIPASMAIDSGDITSSYSNEPEPNGNRINIGAFGNTPEATAGTDTDGDNLTDRQEIALGYDPDDYDMDGDLLPDGWEYDHISDGFDPYDPNDAVEDFDLDDLPNVWEYLNDLDPLDPNGLNGTTGDPDSDGVENFDEYSYNLNPWEDNRGLYETQNEYDDAGQVILTRTLEVKNDGIIYVTETQTVYDVLGRQTAVRQVAVPGRGPGRGADDTQDRLSLTAYNIDGSVAKMAQKLAFSGLVSDPNNLMIDPNDIVTENIYDCLGRVEKTINPEGYETSYTYTTGGKVKTVTDPAGNITTNYYDGAGRLERVVNPLGHSRSMDYDSLGRVLRQIAWEDTNATPTDPNDDTPLMQRWYAYDGAGHVVRQAVLADPNSSLDYIADPNTDKVTDFVYDDAYGDYPGQLTAKMIYYAGTPATAATTTYDYDLLGRRYKTTDPAGNVTLTSFDLAGRVKWRQQTDINPIQGQDDLVTETAYQYDDFGRLWKLIADPNDRTETQTTEYAYGLSQRVQETKPNGVINTTEYNTFGEKIVHVADAGAGGIKQTTEWAYDRVGRMETITGYCDETQPLADQTTVYTYDKLRHVTRITYPDSNDIQYAYNELGQVWKRTDQRDLNTYYVYDDGGNLYLKTNDPNDGGDTLFMADPNNYDPNDAYWAESFTYDGLGRQLTAEKVIDGNEIAASVFVYNALGLLSSEAQTLFGGTQRTVSYGYDQYGYRTSITYPDGTTTITRTNAPNGQIDTLSRSQTELVDYEYLGRRTACRSYNTTTPISADYSYDNLGRLTDIEAGLLVDFHYDYVQNENNIWKKRFDHRSGTPYNEYTYDDIDRVTGITYLDSDTESFVMDDLGNRAGNQTLRDDGTVNFAVDTETNCYTSVGGNSLDYDDAGNLTTDKDGYVYTYDYENRITKIKDNSDSLVASFDYDTQGRRVRVYDAVADSTTLYYYSNNWQVLAEYDDSNTLQAYYVFGNYIDEALLMHRDSADKFYLHDHLYSPVTLTNSSGAVVERYEYDAYGKATVWNAGLTTTYSASQYDNCILFTGREVDQFDNENLTLQYNRNRYLSQYMGCWHTPDPLEYIDGMNLYEHVVSNPIVLIDPSGFIREEPGLEAPPEDVPGSLNDIKKSIEAMYPTDPFEYGDGSKSRPYRSVSEGTIIPRAVLSVLRYAKQKQLNESSSQMCQCSCSSWVCTASSTTKHNWRRLSRRTRLSNVTRAPGDDTPRGLGDIGGIVTMNMAWELTFERELLKHYTFKGDIRCTRSCRRPVPCSVFAAYLTIVNESFWVATRESDYTDIISRGTYGKRQNEEDCLGENCTPQPPIVLP